MYRRPTTMTSSLLLALDSPEATLERVGGKGASLARMVAAGLPVPPGFHITTEAYRRFVDDNQLGDAILSAAAQEQSGDPATLRRRLETTKSPKWKLDHLPRVVQCRFCVGSAAL